VERNVRVRKVVQSPKYPKDHDELWQAAARAVERGGYYPQGVARQLAAVVAAPQRRELLRRIDIPSLVIHGEDDPLVKVECGIDTARHLPNSELALFPGMGHDFPEPLLGEMAALIHATARRARVTEAIA
jgi:pimeloyl-ACP methyl ester carboxylesterase